MQLLATLASLASLACLTPGTPPARQEAAPSAPESVRNATPEARALWERVCTASGPATRAPLSAFQLEAEVLTRSGAQTNEAKIDYRYLAPDCIRFMLPNKSTTGRFGPAPDQYWLQSQEGLVVLAGREYKQDRIAVDQMLALARNYVALSNPAQLDLRALELVALPADLPAELARRARKLGWLALESPNFALVRSEAQREGPALYRVELGIRGEDHLPAFAIVREVAKNGADPLLVEFSDYRARDDFMLPHQLKVHAFDRSVAPQTFAAKPSQEVYVTAAALRPGFTPKDFQPVQPK